MPTPDATSDVLRNSSQILHVVALVPNKLHQLIHTEILAHFDFFAKKTGKDPVC